MNPINRKKIATVCIVMATFLNPAGYDVLVSMVMNLTGSYWTTMGIFYVLSFLFFILYFKLSNVNPVSWFISIIKRLLRK